MLHGFDVGISRRPEDSGLRTPGNAQAGSETAATDIPTSRCGSTTVSQCLQRPSTASRPEPSESSMSPNLTRGETSQRLCPCLGRYFVFCTSIFVDLDSFCVFIHSFIFSSTPPRPRSPRHSASLSSVLGCAVESGASGWRIVDSKSQRDHLQLDPSAPRANPQVYPSTRWPVHPSCMTLGRTRYPMTRPLPTYIRQPACRAPRSRPIGELPTQVAWNQPSSGIVSRPRFNEERETKDPSIPLSPLFCVFFHSCPAPVPRPNSHRLNPERDLISPTRPRSPIR